MTLTFANVRLCQGGTHLICDVSVNGTVHGYSCLLSEVLTPLSGMDKDELRPFLPVLLRSIALGANAANLAQARNAIQAATVKL